MGKKHILGPSCSSHAASDPALPSHHIWMWLSLPAPRGRHPKSSPRPPQPLELDEGPGSSLAPHQFWCWECPPGSPCCRCDSAAMSCMQEVEGIWLHLALCLAENAKTRVMGSRWDPAYRVGPAGAPACAHPGHARACTWDTAFPPHGCGGKETPVTNRASACGLFAQRRRRRRRWGWGGARQERPREHHSLWLPPHT